MLDEKTLAKAQSRFSIIGPAISRAEIDLVFPEEFPGKEDLVWFYLQNNGGSRTRLGGTVYCGNQEHQVSRNNLEEISVEGFYSIHRDAEARVLGFLSMLKHRALMSRKSAEYPKLKEFIEQHMPLA